MVVLHDSECIDLRLQLSGVDQTLQDGMVEISKPEGNAAQVLGPSLDCLNRSVRRPDIEWWHRLRRTAVRSAIGTGWEALNHRAMEQSSDLLGFDVDVI